VFVLGGCWERCKELVVFISEQYACEASWGTLTAAADGMELEARWLLEQGVNISPVRGELAGLLNGLKLDTLLCRREEISCSTQML